MSRKRLFSMVCMFMLCFALPVWAQVADSTAEPPTLTVIPTVFETLTETPTQTPTATHTETPTETATLLPTETATAEPTLTSEPSLTPSLDVAATPTETQTVSLTPDATVTPTETQTATLTPTFTPLSLPTEPPLSLLLTDSFDTGTLYFWTLGAGWALVPSEGGLALSSGGNDEPATFVHDGLLDLAVQLRAQFVGGLFRLSLRQSAAGAYTLLLGEDGLLTLYRGTQVLVSAALPPAAPGQWRTLRFSVIGDTLRVQVDGVEVLAVQDTAPLPPGTFSFAGIGASMLLVDDVELWGMPTEPTATPTRAATATPEALITSTATASPTPFDTQSSFSVPNVSAFSTNSLIFRYVSDVPGLIAALETAVVDPNHIFVIHLAPGTYLLSQQYANTFSFLPDINGGGKANVILVGNMAGHPDALLPDQQVILERAAGSPELDIITNSGSLTLYNLILRKAGGSSRFAGGTLRNYGQMYLYNVVIEDGKANYWGGGILNAGDLYLVNTVFRRNVTVSTVSQPHGGAGLANDGQVGGSFTVDGNTYDSACVTFELNQSQDGGAIFNGQTSSGTINLKKVNFINNSSSYGKTIYSQSPSTTTVTDSFWQPAFTNSEVAGNTLVIPNPPTATAPFALNCSVPPVPKPSWDTNGALIDPHLPIPELLFGNYSYNCATETFIIGYDDPKFNLDCALVAYNFYRNQLINSGKAFTWGNFIALIMRGEGNDILLGYLDSNGVLQYNNPQASHPDSICWRWSFSQGSWVSGFQECNDGVQTHFPYAVTELLFNECAFNLGHPRGIYTDYLGSCSEIGFLSLLGQVESIYKDPGKGFTLDANLYLQRAEYELDQWDQNKINHRTYGQCPCSWENVGDEALARIGTNDGKSYSYFFDPNKSPTLRYFRVY